MGEPPTADQIKLYLPDYDPDKNGPGIDSGITFDWCDSMPLHTVRFERPFYIGKYPVTQSQWRAVTGSNPSKCRFANHPVEQIDWFAAQDFCVKLSERLGRVMRLPSEAEWEYACRAGTQTRCYCGEQIGREDANLDYDTTDADFFSMDKTTNPQTTQVDRYPPNPWGIYDMLGNVEEWCQDSWHRNYVGSPTDGSAWIDKPEPIEHVARGGAAYLMATRCSCGFRRSQRANCGADPQSDDQTIEEHGNSFSSWKSNDYFGLRIVCDALSNCSS
jgi:formylglycine-generating enzyme required for sulfatase activity